ncbi:MAG TPA: cyclomaltodextrinase N-terminal domain-containing protein, partial [Thermomonas sp.]|nr:cyclomaltodextrinase N-terminal domain-containing protein [Thermomonas sp.]
MRLLLACLLCLSAFAPWAQAAAPSRMQIERVEPANWWVGMRHNRVELLVHGKGIAASTPRLSRAGVAIVDVQKTDNPNYLFVTVEIAADAAPGDVDIELVDAGHVMATHRWRLDAREPGSAQRRGFDARDAIYLITPDRFANGDPSNDSMAGMQEAADRANPNGRHGGDIAGIRQHLDYIAGMGFTQLWPTPFLENNQPEYS